MTTEALRAQLWDMVQGKRIGHGISREVYALQNTDALVMKIEDIAGSFANCLEWTVWNWAKDHPRVAKWLAPCRFISANGAILIQDRTSPPHPSQYPKRMPMWMCDFKRTNYGLLNGRLVCHDYGLLSDMLTNGIASREMRDVEWWDLK